MPDSVINWLFSLLQQLAGVLAEYLVERIAEIITAVSGTDFHVLMARMG